MKQTLAEHQILRGRKHNYMPQQITGREKILSMKFSTTTKCANRLHKTNTAMFFLVPPFW